MTDPKPKDLKPEMPREYANQIKDVSDALNMALRKAETVLDREKYGYAIESISYLETCIRQDLAHPAPETAMGVQVAVAYFKETHPSLNDPLTKSEHITHLRTLIAHVSTTPPLPSEAEKLAEAAKLIDDIRGEYFRSLESAVDLLHEHGYKCDSASTMMESFDFRNGKRIRQVHDQVAAYEQSKKENAK